MGTRQIGKRWRRLERFPLKWRQARYRVFFGTNNVTSFSLLLWIALTVLLQSAIFLGIAFWRHWRDYRILRGDETDPTRPGSSAAAHANVPAAWPGWRTFCVERKVVEDAAQTVCSFYLVGEDRQALPDFLPGQFLTFCLDLPKADGGSEKLVRCYSLSDAPNAGHYRVSIKRVASPAGLDVPPGRSSSFFHDHIDVGSRLQVRAPGGHFHIDRSADPLVLIAGGIGITPMLSMLNWCLLEQPGREVWLLYGVRHGRELIMRAHLEALAAAHANFHLWRCFSDPQPDEVLGADYQHGGHIDINLLRLQLPLKPCQFYICGPTPMMQSLVPALDDWGVPEERIHFEAFGPASIKRKQAMVPAAMSAPQGAVDGGIVVSFAQSGKQVPWSADAGSLLEFAEAQGIAVNFGCRAGACGACQTTVRAGEVAYRQPPDYDPSPGTCLLCTCTPKTSVTLEA